MATAPQSLPEPLSGDYTADNPQIEPEQPKSHYSTKPLSLKMQVISKYTLHLSKTQIAKDLGITRNTVTAILKESHFERAYDSAAKYGVNSFILDSVDTLGHHVGRKSLKAAMYVLDNTIFREEAGNGTKLAVQVNVNIPRPAIEQPIKQVLALPDTPSDADTNP